MGARPRMITKLCIIVLIIVATHLISCANSFSSQCAYSHSTVVKCRNLNLTAIPNWIPSNVTEIDLSENPFLKLQVDSFV